MQMTRDITARLRRHVLRLDVPFERLPLPGELEALLVGLEVDHLRVRVQ